MPHHKAQQHQGIGLGKIPTKYSLLVLLATIFLIIVATIGGKNLYFRGDYDIFFDGTNKQLLAFDEIQTTFAKTDNLAIVIAPEDGDIFTPQTLSLIQKITVDAWQVPYSSRVDSIANYQHTEAFDDDLLVEDLLYSEYELTPERISKVKSIALSEPVLKGALVSEKGDVTVVNITVQLPEMDKTAEVEEVVSSINAMIDRYQRAYPDVTFHKAGIIAMNHAFMTAAQDDSSTLVPTMLVVILVFLTIMLRSILSVIATLIVIIGSVMATMGISGWAGMFLSTATVNVPTLIMTLAVADCVHVIATMRQSMKNGFTKVLDQNGVDRGKPRQCGTGRFRKQNLSMVCRACPSVSSGCIKPVINVRPYWRDEYGEHAVHFTDHACFNFCLADFCTSIREIRAN